MADVALFRDGRRRVELAPEDCALIGAATLRLMLTAQSNGSPHAERLAQIHAGVVFVAAGMSAVGHPTRENDTACPPPLDESARIPKLGTMDVAKRLGISPRHAQRRIAAVVKTKTAGRWLASEEELMEIAHAS